MMRKLLDLNVWLALLLNGHKQHSIARRWYEHEVVEPGSLLFCRQTEMGFLRLLTLKPVMRACGKDPFTNRQAVELLVKVLRNEAYGQVQEAPGTRALWLEVARIDQRSPNLWMDSYLAALAITQELELVSFDRGMKSYGVIGLNLKLLPAE